MRADQFERLFPEAREDRLAAQAVKSPVGSKYRNVRMVLHPYGKAGNMVRMLVGEQHGADLLGRAAELGEFGPERFVGDPDVEQQEPVPGIDQKGVSAAAAGQGDELHESSPFSFSAAIAAASEVLASSSLPLLLTSASAILRNSASLSCRRMMLSVFAKL